MTTQGRSINNTVWVNLVDEFSLLSGALYTIQNSSNTNIKFVEKSTTPTVADPFSIIAPIIPIKIIPTIGKGLWVQASNDSANIIISPTPLDPDFHYTIGQGADLNRTPVHKFGRNPDIDSSFEAIWNGGGDYTGFNCTAAEILETFSSVAQDAGAVFSSGNATGGSLTTIEDSSATFVSDGVAIGDAVLNDSTLAHGIVTGLTETEITVIGFEKGGHLTNAFSPGDVYRVVTATSTGAAVLELIYLLDGDLKNQTSEFVVLNGTTPVDTVGSYRRDSRAEVILVGSNESNVGTIITRQKVTTANIMVSLPIGYNGTMIAAYTIPVGFKGSMHSWFASFSGKTIANCSVRLMIRHPGEPFVVKEEITLLASGDSNYLRDYKVPKDSLTGGSDIKIMADTDTVNTGVSGGFDLVIDSII